MTAIDSYDCPEPGCPYTVSAVSTEGYDAFAEEVREHQHGHAVEATPSPWAKAYEVMPPIAILGGFLACLVVGTFSGAALAGAPDVKAPHQCTVMANIAEKAFITYENLQYSVELRATRGQSDYAEHDADVVALRGELDGLGPDYDDAKAACLGVDR